VKGIIHGLFWGTISGFARRGEGNLPPPPKISVGIAGGLLAEI
jgi:hypothetical protein